MSDMNNPADDNNGAMDDLWAEALSEQKSTSGKSAADAVFQQFGGAVASDARVSRGAGRSGGRTAGYSDQRLFNRPGRSGGCCR